jgi:hypothetical protein
MHPWTIGESSISSPKKKRPFSQGLPDMDDDKDDDMALYVSTETKLVHK